MARSAAARKRRVADTQAWRARQKRGAAVYPVEVDGELFNLMERFGGCSSALNSYFGRFLNTSGVIEPVGSTHERAPGTGRGVVSMVIGTSAIVFAAAAAVGVAACARPGNFVTLPNQIVDSNGNITVPYAGTIPAAGRTPSEVQQAINEALRALPRYRSGK